jgi:hypothetical protein
MWCQYVVISFFVIIVALSINHFVCNLMNDCAESKYMMHMYFRERQYSGGCHRIERQ